MNKTIVSIVLVLVVIGGAYYFFAKNSSSGTSTKVSTTTAPVASTLNIPSTESVAVNIQNFSFNPSTLTVKVGTKVTWKNTDSVPHTVTSDSGDLLHSQTIAPGQSFIFTFTTAGSAPYHCAIHPMMKGTIIVTN